tara:strand:+ start:2325 stop:2717 length:393 start_codon:yes stop_codon:yes gene_type:complete
MPKYECEGRVRQRYWGDFSIMVLLTFRNEEEARKALPALQQGFTPSDHFKDAVGDTCESLGWSQGKEYTDMLIVEAGGDDVDKVVLQLVEHGADEPKILSCKHSIDWGEEFTCSIPRVYVDHPNQEMLPL